MPTAPFHAPISHKFTFLVRPHGYLLRWDSTFASDREFDFGDQEEMGLGVRLATPIAVTSQQGGRILDSEGRRNGQGIWGKTADWCDYGGPIQDAFAGITIMPHPENFRPCWCTLVITGSSQPNDSKPPILCAFQTIRK